MAERIARIEQLTIPAGKRVLVISDIHGNLPYLRGLLQKVGFCENDELIIDGDTCEKGTDCLGTVRYIKALSEKGNVHLLLGNCDEWGSLKRWNEQADIHTMKYVKSKKCGILWEACLACGIDPMEVDRLGAVKPMIYERFGDLLDFLDGKPHAIETDRFIFAHGGASRKPLAEHTVDELTHRDAFLRSADGFDKWVIVGHWPVMLYGTDRVCANPIIDRERHIISIDGGCTLKDDGQLNALILPADGSDDFTWEAYDPFPTARVKSAQKESERSYYIRWGDNRVQVLRRGEEFSRCRHVRTGYEMDILTKYLYSDGEYTDCNDCTDYAPELAPGDEVSVVETTSRGYFIKHKGTSGWYYGELL